MPLPRLLLAIAVAAGVVLSAPFVSQVRFWIRSTFPGHFVLVVGGIIAVLIGAAVLAALLRIRDRRLGRYGAIAAALAVAAAYSWAISTPNAQANAVERFHFVEYGLVTFLFYRAWRHLEDGSIFLMPILAGLVVGTMEEWLQWFIPIRIGEMRDVFLNLVAIVCGLLFSVAVDPPARISFALRRRSAARVGAFAAAVTLLVAAFVHSVHLGRAVAHPEAGTFLTRYDPATLDALSAERAARWSTRPPEVRQLSREDQYLSEGILHVQARNERWTAGDAAAAWHENRILEIYFRPVLDVSYPAVSGPRHRWPDDQRADAERRAAASRGVRYTSRADGGFIRTWPPLAVWSIAVLLALAFLGMGLVTSRRAEPEGSVARSG